MTNTDLPTIYELREQYPDSYSVISANLSEAAAWTFTMTAEEAERAERGFIG